MHSISQVHVYGVKTERAKYRNPILHTDLSERSAHSVPGGGREELEMSGASPMSPAEGAERTLVTWIARKRILVNCIIAVAGLKSNLKI